MAKAYWVTQYHSISDPDALAAYAKLAAPAIQAAGGRFVIRGTPVKTYEAGRNQRTVVVEFDDTKKCIAAYDGPAYAEPWVVIYDADTLEPTGQRFLLPASLQRDGVPWIAVDQVRGVAYSMEWKDTGKLFVYSLSDFSLLRTVTLSEPVPRIQGAKIYRGNL